MNSFSSSHADPIVAQNLVRYFGDVKAVDGINITVKTGEIFGFLGPNGAGKSTAVRMLTTLLRPTSGTATVAGFDVAKHPDEVRRRIGVALQDAAIDPLITTVTRDGEFTQEFRAEIAQAYPGVENILYADAVAIVGIASIDQILLGVAGFDGNFVS